jgi:hypothetical protein
MFIILPELLVIYYAFFPSFPINIISLDTVRFKKRSWATDVLTKFDLYSESVLLFRNMIPNFIAITFNSKEYKF